MGLINNSTPDNSIGLLPAAGKGTRLGVPFPKELFPIIDGEKYKPVTLFSVENLVTSNIINITLVINDTKHELIKFIGNGSKFNCDISYVVQEPLDANQAWKSPGLAHALDAAYHQTKEKVVYFCMPDTIIIPNDVFSQARKFAPDNADIVLCLFPTNHPEKYGMVELVEDQVSRIIDKPKSTKLQFMWGCIIWSPKFTELLHEQVTKKDEGDFANIINSAIDMDMKVYGYKLENGIYFDIGTPNEVLEVYEYLHDK